MVALKNPAAYPLLEGRVRSYRGGSYVGDASLRHRGVGEPFEVSLGIDEELKVERKTLDDKDMSAGFLSSTKHIVRGYPHHPHQPRRPARDRRAAREHPGVARSTTSRSSCSRKRTTAGYKLDAARGFVTWSSP